MVTPSRNRELINPNTKRQNLYTTIQGSTDSMLSTQRILNIFLCSDLTDAFKNAFSMSAVRATLHTLNRISMSNNRGNKFGSEYKASFRLISPGHLLEASNTTLNFVVFLSVLTTSIHFQFFPLTSSFEHHFLILKPPS